MAFDSLRAIQPRMADELEKTTESGMMPQSLLFSGVPGSGRLTGALDEAFYLTGEDGSLLSSEHIAYFASRPFRPEIRAAYGCRCHGVGILPLSHLRIACLFA